MPGKNLVYRATGAAAIAEAIDLSFDVELVSVKLHLSAAGGAAENFTVTVDSGTGTAYDVNLLTQDMTTAQDVVWMPDVPMPIAGIDDIDFAYTNTNTRTWGLEVHYRKVGI